MQKENLFTAAVQSRKTFHSNERFFLVNFLGLAFYFIVVTGLGLVLVFVKLTTWIASLWLAKTITVANWR